MDCAIKLLLIHMRERAVLSLPLFNATHNRLGASVQNACNQGYQEDLVNATVGRKLLHYDCLNGQ